VVEGATSGMDQETLVTGGSTAGVGAGLVVLLVGVGVGTMALQAVGGAVVLLSMAALTVYLAGLDEPAGSH
jgi:hypothetical protein